MSFLRKLQLPRKNLEVTEMSTETGTRKKDKRETGKANPVFPEESQGTADLTAPDATEELLRLAFASKLPANPPLHQEEKKEGVVQRPRKGKTINLVQLKETLSTIYGEELLGVGGDEELPVDSADLASIITGLCHKAYISAMRVAEAQKNTQLASLVGNTASMSTSMSQMAARLGALSDEASGLKKRLPKAKEVTFSVDPIKVDSPHLVAGLINMMTGLYIKSKDNYLHPMVSRRELILNNPGPFLDWVGSADFSNDRETRESFKTLANIYRV